MSKYINKLQFIKDFIFKERNSLKIRSLRAASWTILGKGGSDLLRLISNLILTRILYPEAFGLMATGLVIITMIQLFSDTGVKISLIQHPDGENPNYLNTAWIISIIRSTILFLLVVSLSVPIADFYNQPELKSILAVMSIGILINGFENPAVAIIIKKLRAEKQFIYDIGTQLLGFFTTLILAYYFRSVMALAIGYLFLSFYRLIGSYIIDPYRPKLIWNRKAGSELFHFGKYILLNTMITWTTMNADRLIIGKTLNMEMLGVYSIGLNIGIIIEMLFVQILTQSYLPALSSVSYDLDRVQRIFRRTSTLIIAISIPILTVASLFSKEIIHILYDPRYAMAAITMQWISLRGIFRIISILQGQTLIAIGKPSFETISMFLGMIALAITMPYGAVHFGLEGVAVAAFIVGITISFFESIFLIMNVKFSFKIIFRPWLQSVLISGVIGIIYFTFRPYLNHESIYNIPLLILISIIGLALSAIYYLFLEGTNPFKDHGGATKKEVYTL
jgi:O-antigen/teichoic acid export membrane protein